MANAIGPLIKRWYRAEVRNLDNIPAAGGALLVSNHSGGMFTPDVVIFSPAFYNNFGYDRPVYMLAHYGLFVGPLDSWLRRLGVIEASRENASAALHSGAVVLVSPAVTTTLTGQPGTPPPSTSTAAPVTSKLPSSRGPDRADGLDRRPGNPTVFDPWQHACRHWGSPKRGSTSCR